MKRLRVRMQRNFSPSVADIHRFGAHPDRRFNDRISDDATDGLDRVDLGLMR